MWVRPDALLACGRSQGAPRLLVVGAGEVGRRVVEACRRIEIVRHLLADELYAAARRAIEGSPEAPCRVFMADSAAGMSPVDAILLAAKLDSPAALRAVRTAVGCIQGRGQTALAVLAVPVAPAATLRPGAFRVALDRVRRSTDTLILAGYRDPVRGVLPREMALPDHQTVEVILLRVMEALCDRATHFNFWPGPVLLAGLCHAGYGVAPEVDGRATEAARDAVVQIRAARGREEPVRSVLVYFGRGDAATAVDRGDTHAVIQQVWPRARVDFLRGGEDRGARRDFPVTLIASGTP